MVLNSSQAMASNMPLKSAGVQTYNAARGLVDADKKKKDKHKEKKKNKNNPVNNPLPYSATLVPGSGGNLSPNLPNGGGTPTSTPAQTDFETLSSLFERILGPTFGANPDTSQSGESVLVVPGDEGGGQSQGSKGLIILLFAVGGIAAYMYYKKKKAA